MRPKKESKRRNRPSSPIKDWTTAPSRYEERSPRSRAATPGVSVLDQDLVTNDITLLEELSITQDLTNSNLNRNSQSFPCSMKQQCWGKAEKIKGRDLERWRCDALANIVFRKLVGCPGCLCHDYDHIGRPSTLENCQVLQATVNRSKVFEIALSSLGLNLVEKVLTVEYQVETWISSSCQPMATYIAHKIPASVESNDQVYGVILWD